MDKEKAEINDVNIEQTLDNINEIVKIEKIRENDSFFDQLADDIEIEIRDVLINNEVLSAKMESVNKRSSKRVFRLQSQNIIFDFPPPFTIPEKGNIKDFTDNIQVKVISPKKRKLSAKEKERRKLNIMFYKFGRTVALAVMLFALGMIGEQIYGYVSDYEHNERIKNDFGVGDVIDVTPNREIPGYPKATPVRLTYPGEIADINTLKSLEEKSDDFRFWLYVNGTGINYYVLQADDNNYYLKRNIEKDDNSSGSLFLDYRNRIDRITGNAKYEIGSNNIIYGHNMKNGAMFGLLKKFQEKDYFTKHQYIYTYSTDGVTIWKAFSAYETTTDDYYIQTYFTTPSEYLTFIRNLQEKSVINTDVILTSKDDILTLSTCHRYNIDNGRFVVHAIKLGTAPIN